MIIVSDYHQKCVITLLLTYMLLLKWLTLANCFCFLFIFDHKFHSVLLVFVFFFSSVDVVTFENMNTSSRKVILVVLRSLRSHHLWIVITKIIKTHAHVFYLLSCCRMSLCFSVWNQNKKKTTTTTTTEKSHGFSLRFVYILVIATYTMYFFLNCWYFSSIYCLLPSRFVLLLIYLYKKIFFFFCCYCCCYRCRSWSMQKVPVPHFE